MDLEAFADALVARGYARKTVAVYCQTIRRASAHLDPATATAAEIREYSESLPHARSSRAALRSSLAALWEATGRPDRPLGAVRVPSHPRMRSKALDHPQAAALAAHAQKVGDRKGLVVLLGLYAGLRRAEIAALRWTDVGSDGWLTLVGKGDVTATLPLHPRVLRVLARIRRGARGQWVFPGRRGGHAHPTTLWGWVRELGVDAGVGPVPTHVLRHTCLTTALDTTRDLRAVQDLARHAKPETTAGYTRVHRDRLAETVAAISYEGA